MLVRLLAIALGWLSLLVPEAGQRARWRARWADSLEDYALWLGSRGYPRDEIRRRLSHYVRDGAAEAFAARWPTEELAEAWRRLWRSARVALVFPLAVLAAGWWWSEGLALLRSASRPLVASVGDRLVTAVPDHSFFGKNRGFTARQFGRLKERSQSYSTLTGYSMRHLDAGAPGGAVSLRRVAFAMPEFFSALGFQDGHAYVAEQLGAGWIGRTVEIAGQPYRIAGVWPKNFRPAQSRPDFWIPGTPAGFHTTMVAVLKPGVTAAQATQELREILLSASAGSPNVVIPLAHSQAGVLGSLWIGFLLLEGGLVALVAYRILRRRAAWRLELFFLAGTLPLVAGLFGCSVAGFAIPAAGTVTGPFLVCWLTGMGAALGVWWARRDQHLRCPHCLARMTLSVRIGTHGASLLEGVGDEFLCEYGHGSLWLPGVQSQAFGPEVWRDQ